MPCFLVPCLFDGKLVDFLAPGRPGLTLGSPGRLRCCQSPGVSSPEPLPRPRLTPPGKGDWTTACRCDDRPRSPFGVQGFSFPLSPGASPFGGPSCLGSSVFLPTSDRLLLLALYFTLSSGFSLESRQVPVWLECHLQKVLSVCISLCVPHRHARSALLVKHPPFPPVF